MNKFARVTIPRISVVMENAETTSNQLPLICSMVCLLLIAMVWSYIPLDRSSILPSFLINFLFSILFLTVSVLVCINLFSIAKHYWLTSSVEQRELFLYIILFAVGVLAVVFILMNIGSILSLALSIILLSFKLVFNVFYFMIYVAYHCFLYFPYMLLCYTAHIIYSIIMFLSHFRLIIICTLAFVCRRLLIPLL